MKIAFSGARKIEPTEESLVLWVLAAVENQGSVLVGCAPGVDKLVRENCPTATVYRVKGARKWHFAARSQQMIDDADLLYAFPNKPCPDTCTPKAPFSGHGSGTWGTIAYAKKRGVQVVVHPLVWSPLPSWLVAAPESMPEQLALF